jgi:hypothetical protein
MSLMKYKIIERFTFSELAKVCELSDQEMHELIEYGAINSEDSKENELFSAMMKVRHCHRCCGI